MATNINPQQVELAEALAELRTLFPDWRFGQMVENLLLAAGLSREGDIWDAGDDQLLEAARRLIDHNQQRRRQVRSMADGLPPDIARQVHPDWRKNEAAYWEVRDQLLAQYQGHWIGFADGAVIAAGTSPVQVLHAAQSSGRHPFFICVGMEDEPCRIRRTSFPYNQGFPGEPLPLVRVEFSQVSGSPGVVLDRVIPDTGADASVLPWSDCQSLQLNPSNGFPGFLGGVTGGSVNTIAFQIWARLDGQEYACRVQADLVGSERILGRDVLNQLEMLFRGPAREVIVNP